MYKTGLRDTGRLMKFEHTVLKEAALKQRLCNSVARELHNAITVKDCGIYYEYELDITILSKTGLSQASRRHDV